MDKTGLYPPSPLQPQPPTPVKLLVWIWTKIYTLIYVDEIYALPIWAQHMRQLTGWVIISSVNTLKPKQDGRHFPDDILEWILVNENLWISNKVSLDFIPRDPINNIPALFTIMAWHRPGDKPLSIWTSDAYASLGLNELIACVSWGQAITKTNDDLLLIGDFGTNLGETENTMQNFLPRS